MKAALSSMGKVLDVQDLLMWYKQEFGHLAALLKQGKTTLRLRQCLNSNSTVSQSSHLLIAPLAYSHAELQLSLASDTSYKRTREAPLHQHQLKTSLFVWEKHLLLLRLMDIETLTRVECPPCKHFEGKKVANLESQRKDSALLRDSLLCGDRGWSPWREAYISPNGLDV